MQAIVPVVLAVQWRSEAISALAWAIGLTVVGSVLSGAAEGGVTGGAKLRPISLRRPGWHLREHGLRPRGRARESRLIPPRPVPQGRLIASAIIGGVVLSAANLTGILARTRGRSHLSGVVITLYPVTKALLARVFLRDHLKALHIVGITAALRGCATLGFS